jgi:hypothetical protein
MTRVKSELSHRLLATKLYHPSERRRIERPVCKCTQTVFCNTRDGTTDCIIKGNVALLHFINRSMFNVGWIFLCH